MKGYLLDTDICVFFLRGKFQLTDKIDQIGFENCFVSEVTIAELFFGAENSEDPAKHLKQVDKFASEFKIVPIFDVLKLYAKEKVHLRKSGTMIAEFDLLIGVTAVANELIMVTRNTKHFKRIRDIQLENWTDKAFNDFL